MCETVYHFCICKFNPKECKAIAHWGTCVCHYSEGCRVKEHKCICVTDDQYLGLAHRCKANRHVCVCRVLGTIEIVKSLECTCWSPTSTNACKATLHMCSCYYDDKECKSTYHMKVCGITRNLKRKDMLEWKNDKYNCCVKVEE